MLKKISIYFLSSLLLAVSVTVSHHHERRDISSYSEFSTTDSDCEECALKFSLQNILLPPSTDFKERSNTTHRNLQILPEIKDCYIQRFKQLRAPPTLNS